MKPADDDKLMSRKDLIKSIMSNSIGTLEEVTTNENSIDYLSNKTPFGETILKTLENENNDLDYILTALNALNNYLYT